MTRKSIRRPVIRRLAILGGSLAALVLLVEAAASLTRWTHNRRVRHLGDNLHLKVTGLGDPIIFLHGLRASGRYWEPRIESLASDHQILIVDLLGFGRSPWPADSAYSLDDHLAAVRRSIAPVVRNRRFTLVGHSMGAILAAEYARRHPDEISHLILLNAPMFRSPAEAKAGVREMSALAAIFSFQTILARGACDLMCATRPLLYRVAPRLDPAVPPHVARDGVLHRWQSFDGTMENVILSSNLEAILRDLRDVPVTIIHGTDDSITSRERLEAIAAETGAQLVFIEGGHNMYLKNPGRVIAEIRRALEPR